MNIEQQWWGWLSAAPCRTQAKTWGSKQTMYSSRSPIGLASIIIWSRKDQDKKCAHCWLYGGIWAKAKEKNSSSEILSSSSCHRFLLLISSFENWKVVFYTIMLQLFIKTSFYLMKCLNFSGLPSPRKLQGGFHFLPFRKYEKLILDEQHYLILFG